MEKSIKRYMPIFVLPTFFCIYSWLYRSFYYGNLAFIL